MQDDVRSSDIFLIFRINTRDNTNFVDAICCTQLLFGMIF